MEHTLQQLCVPVKIISFLQEEEMTLESLLLMNEDDIRSLRSLGLKLGEQILLRNALHSLKSKTDNVGFTKWNNELIIKPVACYS